MMKKLIFLQLFILISFIFTASVAAKVNLEMAAGIWLFDENDGDIANDSSGNGNHGQIMNGEWVEGKFGSAIILDGISTPVVVPDSDSLDLQEAWTITAWTFVNESESSYGHILGKRNDGLNEANYAFRIANNGTTWEGYFKRAGAWQGVWGKGSVDKGEWHYMTATYDGEGMFTMYQDAVQFGSGDIGAPPPAGQADVIIGGWQNNVSELLDGILDEVGLFAVALEVDDIEELMNEGINVALGITPVEASGKLTSTWGSIKDK
ncbi:hypothetical protein GF312_20100 [Candidatus Poribacteria bacterium]|nr:hypothetical protein [Candidatus Poribacteria bacterium]